MKRCVQVAPIHFWLRCRDIGVKPGYNPIDLIFVLAWDIWNEKKLDRFLPTPLVTPSLPLCCTFLCFTFAFGALRAPCGFDLGQKEIGNQAFCMFAAVPNHHCE